MTSQPVRTPSRHRPTRTRPAHRALVLVGALAALAALIATGFNVATPTSAATAATAAHPQAAANAQPSASGGANGSWAWGGVTNATVSVDFAGVANSSSGLTGGNLTMSGAPLVLAERLHVELAFYVIVNASTPTPGHRYVTVQAAQLRAMGVQVAASGSFPVAGNYTANQTIPLAQENVALNASIALLSGYAAYLNFTTGPNASLSLNNEHLVAETQIAVSMAAQNFPNVTRNATTGNTAVSYSSGAFAVQAYSVTDLSAVFQPALLLIDGPLSVGKNWTSNSTVSFTGAEAYAIQYSAKLPSGTTATAGQSGQAAINATVPVSLTFTVLGTQNVTLPGGTNETDYVIGVQNNLGNGSGVWVANGLLVDLAATDSPASAPTASTITAAPAKSAITSAEPTSRSLYSPSRALPDSEQATPSGGSSVTAAPMTPSEAHTMMANLGHPAPPAPAPSSIGGEVVLLGVVAVAGVAFLVWELRRSRRPVL
jgi:hypothetical protein